MNRVGMGLAIGAGYVLGRTKKAKLAFAVGSLVAGKRMHLSPRALADLRSQQLQNNPQFKEIGDQLREDLRGVGKAASGAMVERQLDSLADRLHGRTAQVRDQLAGVVPQTDADADEESDESDESEEAEESEEAGDSAESQDSGDSGRGEEPPRQAAKKAPGKKAAAKKAPARKAEAGRSAAKKTAGKKTAARKPAGKKTTAARGAARNARTRLPKGGDER